MGAGVREWVGTDHITPYWPLEGLGYFILFTISGTLQEIYV